ncbi:hypothetical protein BT69DRAFT_1340194 [Atractiella rhizophila]|nr:hypothetical protein BT69DRAFT_1340194 [Atractiella rhizophila]
MDAETFPGSRSTEKPNEQEGAVDNNGEDGKERVRDEKEEDEQEEEGKLDPSWAPAGFLFDPSNSLPPFLLSNSYDLLSCDLQGSLDLGFGVGSEQDELQGSRAVSPPALPTPLISGLEGKPTLGPMKGPQCFSISYALVLFLHLLCPSLAVSRLEELKPIPEPKDLRQYFPSTF